MELDTGIIVAIVAAVVVIAFVMKKKKSNSTPSGPNEFKHNDNVKQVEK